MVLSDGMETNWLLLIILARTVTDELFVLSRVDCRVKTSLPLDAVIKPTLFMYHSWHCHWGKVAQSISWISAPVKVKNWRNFSGLGWESFLGYLSNFSNMIPRVLSSRPRKLFEWVFSQLDLGRCNFWRRGKITGIRGGTMVLNFFVNDASSSLDLTLRYFGCRGSNSIFWTQVYYRFFFFAQRWHSFDNIQIFYLARLGARLRFWNPQTRTTCDTFFSTVVQQCVKGIHSSDDMLATSIPSTFTFGKCFQHVSFVWPMSFQDKP